jgi:tetratricopeptide (TPR) repeat protein
VVLAVATLAVYSPVATHGYVNYDDSDYVSGNAHVQGGLAWENIVWAFRTGHASNWHPLTWLSHMLDCQLFGNRVGVFHVENVLFHAANALLLFLLLRRMTGALWRSAFVAALFALHPLHVESVAWISERKDMLSTLFFLLTLWAYCRYAEAGGGKSEGRGPKAEGGPKSEVRSPKSGSRTRHRVAGIQNSAFSIQYPASSIPAPASWPAYALCLAFFALGLMSKPMLVTLPFVLLLLDYWPLRRFAFAARQQSNTQSTKPLGITTRGLVVEKLPFFALVIASSVITFIVQRKGGAVSTALTLWERIENALVSYARYIGKMLWPDDLSVLYPHPGHWPAGRVIACGALLVAITAGALALARRRPYLPVGWLWFIGTMIPVIGLVQVGIQSMADRYTYVPMIGLFIMLAWGLWDLVPPRPWREPALATGAALALAACALLTVRQVQIWRDSEALFLQAVRVTSKNYLAYNNLGFYYSGKGRVDEAMTNYLKSLEIKPDYEDALNNLGYALAGRKQYAEAIRYYERALRLRPLHPEVNNNLGNALSEIGRLDEAIAHYKITLQQNPEHADAHNNYGIALAMKGKFDEAIDHFHQAIRYKPGYASAHGNLGNALAVQHKLDEAAKEFEVSLKLNPDDAQGHNNLGNVRAEQGRLDEAIAQYQKALMLNTNNPEAHFNLALALVRQNKRDEALTHLTEALRQKPDYAEARRQLELLRAPR